MNSHFRSRLVTAFLLACLFSPALIAQSVENYVERNVTFPSRGQEVRGTVCLPSKLAGKVPLLLLVSAVSPNDKGGKSSTSYLFRELSHALAGTGVGTLRYDNRAFLLPTSATRPPITVDSEFTNDAVAALQYAGTIPEIDSAALFILGHGMGGTLAPYLAKTSRNVRGLILAAAATEPIDHALAQQTRAELMEQGKSEHDIQEALDAQAKIFADIRSGKTPASRMIRGAPASYWLDWMSRDPIGELEKLKLPVLVLQGGKDPQVSEEDYDRLQKLLNKPGLNAQAYWFPELNHWLMAPSGDRAAPAQLEQQVIKQITNFVRK